MIEVVARLQRHQEQLGDALLGISHASWLRDLAGEVACTVVPVVGGQTVWSAGPEAFVPVIEQPNWFGRIEKTSPHDERAITLLWWKQAASADTATIAAYRSAGSMAATRNLAGRLRQIPGVGLPHGQPESPWFVVSLPGNASNVAERLRLGGFAGCRPLGMEFPEFPGGMRIEVAWSAADNEQFAVVLQRSLER